MTLCSLIISEATPIKSLIKNKEVCVCVCLCFSLCMRKRVREKKTRRRRREERGLHMLWECESKDTYGGQFFVELFCVISSVLWIKLKLLGLYCTDCNPLNCLVDF